MAFYSWLRNRTPSCPRRGQARHRPKPSRFRPQLEVLEDRTVPSTLTVTTAADSSTNPIPGSLRYEIGIAQNGDTIVFDKSLSGQTIALNGQELLINKNLDIEGLGASKLAISGGGNGSRVFEVGYGVQVTLAGMTIENGDGSFGPPNIRPFEGAGGGILNLGTLTLSGDTLSGNTAAGAGGGIANEHGATLTVTGSTLLGNFAGQEGGGIYNDGTMVLSSSTVTGNSTGTGGEGGGIFNDSAGNLTMVSSTLKSNKPDDLYNLGSAAWDKSTKVGKVGP